MAFELREGQGTLHRNAKKEGKQPDYRGELMLDGVLMEIGAWIKEGKKGKWMSLAVKPKEERAPAKHREPAERLARDEEIPF